VRLKSTGLGFAPLDFRGDRKSQAAGDGLSPWTLNGDQLKAGQAQLVAQAWARHERERKLVSQSASEINEVFHDEWKREMQKNLNETFAMSLTLEPAASDGAPLLTEVFTTVQQVIKQAQPRGHLTGTPMSLETGWNFLNVLDRKAALRQIDKEKPFLVVLAFPCGPWSALMRLNPSKNLEQLRAEGRVLIQFALDLARLQAKNGRHFLLENPGTSEAWNLDMLIRFLEEIDSHTAVFDQCRFGLRGQSGLLHRKTTRIETSSPCVAKRLDGKRCLRDHDHEMIIGGKHITGPAGHYPTQLAKEIVLRKSLMFRCEAMMFWQLKMLMKMEKNLNFFRMQ
jgi:hypothetical protein